MNGVIERVSEDPSNHTVHEEAHYGHSPAEVVLFLFLAFAVGGNYNLNGLPVRWSLQRLKLRK